MSQELCRECATQPCATCPDVMVQRLRDRKQAIAWRRGQDTDYPTKWEPDALCQAAAAEIERLRAENFTLAAGQCANVTADEGGTPQCAEIARLRPLAERYLWIRDSDWDCFDSSWLVAHDIYGEGPAELDAVIDGYRAAPTPAERAP